MNPTLNLAPAQMLRLAKSSSITARDRYKSPKLAQETSFNKFILYTITSNHHHPFPFQRKTPQAHQPCLAPPPCSPGPSSPSSPSRRKPRPSTKVMEPSTPPASVSDPAGTKARTPNSSPRSPPDPCAYITPATPTTTPCAATRSRSGKTANPTTA